MSFSHLERCAQLGQADLELAVGSREDCRDLLARMSEISGRPDSGAAAVVSVFAAIASDACDWLEGDLVVELVEDDEKVTVRVSTDLGAGARENIFEPFVLHVALAEVTGAIERTPAVLGTLKLRKISWKRASLLAKEPVRKTTIPPPDEALAPQKNGTDR